MHWIENALANVNLEALNDVLIWVIHTLNAFSLTIGSGTSPFETTIPIVKFSGAFFTLAYLIVVSATVIKLWITMMSPFDEAEEPGAIALRFIGASIGVAASQRIFLLFQTTFNGAYKKFRDVFMQLRKEYKSLPWNEFEEASSDTGKGFFSRLMDALKMVNNPSGEVIKRIQDEDKDGAFDFNFFGGDKLINPANTNGLEASLGVLILELIIGCTLIVCLFRLILEVYERYVLFGVMYYTAPLAFSSIIGRNSQIFKNWVQMLVAQFILMCTNLVFIGGFLGAWYNIMNAYVERGKTWVFDSPNQYFTTMFILIGWLVIGQKLDQHLKGLGLSTAQTGAGLMGALAGGAVMARTALGVAGSALGKVGGGVRKAATGNLPEQKAWAAGRASEGKNGGLIGALGYDIAGPSSTTSNSSASKSTNQNNSDPKITSWPSSRNDNTVMSADERMQMAKNDQDFIASVQDVAEKNSAISHNVGDAVKNFNSSGDAFIASANEHSALVVSPESGYKAEVFTSFQEAGTAHPGSISAVPVNGQNGAVNFEQMTSEEISHYKAMSPASRADLQEKA